MTCDNCEILKKKLEALEEEHSHCDLSSECIMLMRGHLESVGVEATFADDAAAEAARVITNLRAHIVTLKAHLQTCVDALPKEAGVSKLVEAVIKKSCEFPTCRSKTHKVNDSYCRDCRILYGDHGKEKP